MIAATPSDPFQAIADPSRREILKLLRKGPQPVNGLAANFDMSRPAVSKHIRILYASGFIAVEEKGRERYYRLHQKGFNALRKWVDYYESFWDMKLMALEKFLEEPQPVKRKKRTSNSSTVKHKRK